MNFFYWLVCSSFKLLFYVFYRHRVYGLENVPEGPAIFAPNHVSFYDPPIVAASLNEQIHFLARASLFDHRFLGFCLRRLNVYPVTGTHQDLASFKILCKLLKEKKKVVVFPEGERSYDNQLGEIKSGIGMLALRCDSPIVPVYIEGAFEVYPRHRRIPKLFGKTACYFGKPIYPADFSEMGKKEAQLAIAEEVEKSIKDLCRRHCKPSWK